MSDDVIITVEHLSKRYRLGQIGATTMRESAERLWHRLRGRDPDLCMAKVGISQSAERKAQSENREVTPSSGSILSASDSMRHAPCAVPSNDTELWALKDVSFEVQRGEVLGIIGRNGAGKSTLLKILTRITEPTSGRAIMRGRVASLLEVGTGFHPELTGRENIFLNGAILGMRKAEIAAKFDEIVTFSEVERFIDTPVKRYSSGMYVRLAFAVAAHLDPEILLIDEVLAVGDIAFQKKCLGKMGDVAREGRTVLFVSHNMAAVTSLCGRLVLLRDGEVGAAGDPRNIIGQYVDSGGPVGGERVWLQTAAAPGNDRVRLRSVRILQDDRVTSDVCVDRDVVVEIEFINLLPGARLSSSIHLLDRTGIEVLASANMPSACVGTDVWFGRDHPLGLFRSRCHIPANFLNTTSYSVNALVLADVSSTEASAREAVSFTVHETGEMRKEFTGGWLGVVRPRLRWQTEHVGIDPGQREALK